MGWTCFVMLRWIHDIRGSHPFSSPSNSLPALQSKRLIPCRPAGLLLPHGTGPPEQGTTAWNGMTKPDHHSSNGTMMNCERIFVPFGPLAVGVAANANLRSLGLHSCMAKNPTIQRRIITTTSRLRRDTIETQYLRLSRIMGQHLSSVLFGCTRSYTLGPCLRKCLRMHTRNSKGAYAGVFLD